MKNLRLQFLIFSVFAFSAISIDLRAQVLTGGHLNQLNTNFNNMILSVDTDNNGIGYGSFRVGFDASGYGSNAQPKPNFSEKLTLLENGRFGLNMPFPEAGLHLYGADTSALIKVTNTYGESIYLGSHIGEGYGDLGIKTEGTHADFNILSKGEAKIFTGPDYTERLHITKEGQIITQSEEKAGLVIKATDNQASQGIAFQNVSGNYTWNLYRKGAGSYNADLVFAGGKDTDIDDLSEVMYLSHTGNVGIGTTTPDKGRLHIKGSVHVENSTGDQVFHISAGKELVFLGAQAYEKWQEAGHNPDSLYSDEDYSLWVSEGIVSENYSIAAPESWLNTPDYVFESTYQLPRLEEVEAYVKENKHLPEIPSAKEINEKGYSLVDMDMAYLKKIEELILYAIEQEKRIQQLEKELSHQKELEARIKALEEKLR